VTGVLHDERSISRRGALRLGGLTVAVAAVVAACDNTEAGQTGRVGIAPTTTKLPAAEVTDTALLRTCSSLQYTLLDLYGQVIDKPDLLDPTHRPLFQRLMSDAQSTAKIFEDLTAAKGGIPWTCGNTRWDSAIIQPSMQRITQGAPATPEAKAIPPSDDPRRDVLNLSQGLESIIGSSYQQFTTLFNAQDLHEPSVTAGVRGSRHSALLALTINPGGYISQPDETSAAITQDTAVAGTGPTTTAPSMGNTTTTAPSTETKSGSPTPTAIPEVYALPWTFGSTSTVTVIIGAPDENGTRLKVLLDTPSLNSMEYDYLGACSG